MDVYFKKESGTFLNSKNENLKGTTVTWEMDNENYYATGRQSILVENAPVFSSNEAAEKAIIKHISDLARQYSIKKYKLNEEDEYFVLKNRRNVSSVLGNFIASISSESKTTVFTGNNIDEILPQLDSAFREFIEKDKDRDRDLDKEAVKLKLSVGALAAVGAAASFYLSSDGANNEPTERSFGNNITQQQVKPTESTKLFFPEALRKMSPEERVNPEKLRKELGASLIHGSHYTIAEKTKEGLVYTQVNLNDQDALAKASARIGDCLDKQACFQGSGLPR